METGDNNIRIEERLKSWRSGLFGGGLSKDDKDELQGHLEEAFSELLAKGLSEEEAWMLATHRIGSVDVIKGEYKKVINSRVPLFNHLFYWGMVIILLIQLADIGTDVFLTLIRVSTFPPYGLIFFLILLAITSRIIYKHKALKRNSGAEVFFTSISLVLLSLAFGFFAYFDGPMCFNENPVFANNPPGSARYKTELLKQFTRMGTDNMYYSYQGYRFERGRDYMIVRATGKDFCAEFPLEITGEKKLENLIRVKGVSYGGEIRELKFDVVLTKVGAKFVFRDMYRIMD